MSYKEKLASLINIETHEADYKKLELQMESLSEIAAHNQVAAEKAQERIAQLEEELELLKADDQGRLEILKEDIKELENTYKERIIEADAEIAEAKMIKDECKQKIHGAFARGRMAAYSELGVRVIKAHEHGDEVKVVVNDDAEIDEVIEVMSDEKLADFIEKEDIDIDDLVDIL